MQSTHQAVPEDGIKKQIVAAVLFAALLMGNTAIAVEIEATVDACSDKTDNDGDGHIDCDDQDCEIFAICVKPAEPKAEEDKAQSDEMQEKKEDKKEDEDEIINRPFSLALFPYVTTDGGAEGKVENNFSLNFIGWGDYLTGVDLSSIGAIRKNDVKGVQLSGVFNYVHEETSGLQASGVFNVSGGEFKGAQGSSVANVTGGKMTGIQGSGVANVAKSVKGVQISGVANVAAQEMQGVQIGVINVGIKAKGLQLGVINIAAKEMKGAQIGIVNFAGDGILAPTIWGSDTSMLNLGLKMGTKHFFGILGAGMHPIGDDKRYSAIFGLGGHIDLGKLPLWIELDVVFHNLIDADSWNNDRNQDSVSKLRATLGISLIDQLSIFAGPTLNYLVSNVRDDVSLGYAFYETTRGDTNFQLSPGFTLGLQWQPQVGSLNSPR